MMDWTEYILYTVLGIAACLSVFFVGMLVYDVANPPETINIKKSDWVCDEYKVEPVGHTRVIGKVVQTYYVDEPVCVNYKRVY